MKKILLLLLVAGTSFAAHAQKVFSKSNLTHYVNKEVSCDTTVDVTIVFREGVEQNMNSVQTIYLPHETVSVESELRRAGTFKDAPVFWFFCRNEKDEVLKASMLQFTDGVLLVINENEDEDYTCFFKNMNPEEWEEK